TFRFLFSSRRRHTRFSRDWSSDVCSSDLSTLIRWRMEDAEFDKKFKETQEAVADALEDIAFERAKNKSDILLMFLLNGLRPEKYKYRVEHGGKINFNISADVLGEADKNAPGLKRA